MASMYEMEKNVAELMEQVNRILDMLEMNQPAVEIPLEEINTDPDA